MAEEIVNETVRRLLAESRRPAFAASQILARYGNGSGCAVCARHIGADDVMYQLRFGGGATAEQLSMHLPCFLAWERALPSEHRSL